MSMLSVLTLGFSIILGSRPETGGVMSMDCDLRGRALKLCQPEEPRIDPSAAIISLAIGAPTTSPRTSPPATPNDAPMIRPEKN